MRLPVIGRSCQSSRPVGAMSHPRVRAWIQYSRLRPPGCGSGVGNVSVVLRPRARRALDLGGERVGLAGGVGVVEPDLLAADRAQQGGTGGEAEEGAAGRAAVGHPWGVRLPTSCQQAGASIQRPR